MPNPKIEGRKKRKYVRNIQRMRATKGCLTDCVAYYFNVHPQNVPYFVYPRTGWNLRLKQYFEKRGYECEWDYWKKPKDKKLHIVSCNSRKWKTFAHSVVMKGGKVVFDPNLYGKPLLPPTHILKVKKIRVTP